MLSKLVTIAALVALSATIVRMMIPLGRLDMPGPRSSHHSPTPKGGGVGVAVSFLAGSIILRIESQAQGVSLLPMAALLVASAGLAIIAYWDDLADWHFAVKLAAQVAAAIVLVASLGRLTTGLDALDRLPAVNWMLAVCWMVIITNAVNFMDGLNGLAAGSSLIACLFVAVPFGINEGAYAGVPALALAAGLAGFLPFNFPRARIFMGDVGSQLCGFVLASFPLLVIHRHEQASTALLMPMLSFGLIFDVGLTLVRRLIRGDDVTLPHRDHLYQLAHRRGLSAVTVTLVHWGMTLWGGGCFFISQLAPGNIAFPLAGAALLAPQLGWWILVIAAKPSTIEHRH